MCVCMSKCFVVCSVQFQFIPMCVYEVWIRLYACTHTHMHTHMYTHIITQCFLWTIFDGSQSWLAWFVSNFKNRRHRRRGGEDE